jgi:hypothetical protein
VPHLAALQALIVWQNNKLKNKVQISRLLLRLTKTTKTTTTITYICATTILIHVVTHLKDKEYTTTAQPQSAF